MSNTIYIDDSGKMDHSPVLILAGYLASDHRWETFNAEWWAILKSFEMTTFHATDVWRLGYRSKVRTPLRRSALLVQLIECINRNLEHLFVVSMPFESHAHWFATEQFKEPALRIYGMTFYSLMTLVHQHAYKYRYDAPLQVVFDEQGGESQSMILDGIAQFRGLSAGGFPGFEVKTPIYMSDDGVPGLQAADLIAWLAQRDAVNANRRVERNGLAEAVLLDRALAMPKTMKIWTEEQVKKASEDVAVQIMKAARDL